MQKTNLLDNSDIKIHIREKIIKEFRKPIFENKFYINKEYLLLDYSKYELNKESWIQNPQAFSLEAYGEFHYYRIILLVNNIGSVMQFKPDRLKHNYIIVPKEYNIVKIANSIKL